MQGFDPTTPGLLVQSLIPRPQALNLLLICLYVCLLPPPLLSLQYSLILEEFLHYPKAVRTKVRYTEPFDTVASGNTWANQ